MRNQYYSAGWTPEDLWTRESGILWGAVQSLHSLYTRALPCRFLKELDAKQSRRSFRCAAGMKVSITGPGLCLCCVSTSSRFISFPVSPICMCGQKYLGKKNSFCFLTLVLKHGRWQLSFRVSSSRLWLTVSKHGLSGFASSSPLLSAAVFTEVLLLNWPKQIPQWQP